MKSKYEISDLRQYLDVLGAQIAQGNTVPMDMPLVRQTCKNIIMEVADTAKPLPNDVFAEGLNETLRRAMVTGMVMTIFTALAGGAKKAAK